MNEPLICWRADGAADVTFPYDAYVVAEIKRVVPSPLRTYDPDTKTWTVAGRYVSAVYHVLAQVFGDVDVEGQAHRVRQSSDDPWVILHLRPTAPPELVSAAHKVLARLHHPDAGGSTATMQMINSAVEQIREAS